MNNLSAKNIIYNLQKNKDMPCQEANDVSLKANQIIYTSVNNNFQKMVNNDLYIQKQLLNKQNYIYGPKLSSEVTVKNAENGYKVWDPDLHKPTTQKVSILQKEEKPITETLQQVSGGSGVNANLIFSNKDYGTLIGSTDGIYKTNAQFSQIEKISTLVGSVNSETQLPNGQSLIGTTTGIWNLSSKTDEIHKIADYTDTNDIYSLSGTIFRSTDSGLYMYDYQNDKLVDETKLIGIEEKTYSSIDNKGKILAATDSGVYEGERVITIVKDGDSIHVDGNIKKLINLRGVLFVVSDTGLSSIIGNTVKELVQSSNVNSVREIENNIYVAIGGNGSAAGIKKYNKGSNSLEPTGITAASYDISRGYNHFFIGTTSGTIYSDDLNTYSQVSATTDKIDKFVSFDSILYYSMKDSPKIKKISSFYAEYLTKMLNQTVMDVIIDGSFGYAITNKAIYDNNLTKIYTFESDIASCKLIRVENITLNGIYALTDKGIFYINDSGVEKMSDMHILDMKASGLYYFKLDTDNKLYYSDQIEKNMWDNDVNWIPMYEGVRQIETIGSSAYFLCGNKLLSQTVYSKAEINNNPPISTPVDKITNFVCRGDEIMELSDADTYYTSPEGKTYAILFDNNTVELSAVQTSPNLRGEVMKNYTAESETVFVNKSRPRMPMMVNGENLRELCAMREIVQLKDEEINVLTLSSLDVIRGVPYKTKNYSHTGTHFNDIFEYKDNSENLDYQDGNITFITGRDSSGNYSLKYTKPIRVNDTYVNLGTGIDQVQLMSLPETLENKYLLTFQPELIGFKNKAAYYVQYDEGMKKNPRATDIIQNSESGTFINQFQSKDWILQKKNIKIPEYGLDYPISVYYRGQYELYSSGLYKNYYTVVTNKETGKEYDSYQTFILNSKIAATTLTSIPAKINKAVKVSTPPSISNGCKVVEDGLSTYYICPKTSSSSGKMYYNKKLDNISTSDGWTLCKFIEKGIIKFTYADVCDNTGFFVSDNSLSIVSNVSKYSKDDTSFKPTVKSLSFTPTGIQTIVLSKYNNRKSIVILYDDKHISYITSDNKIVELKTLTVGKFTEKYRFPVCDDERYCILDTLGQIHQIYYKNNKVELKTSSPFLRSGNIQQVYQYEDISGQYCAPGFDITIDTETSSKVFINGYKTDYSSSGLTNVISYKQSLRAFGIGNDTKTIYLSKGNLLRRKTIDPEIPFEDQLTNFNDWDNYDQLWEDENYLYGNVKSVIKADKSLSGTYGLYVLTDRNIVYESDYKDSGILGKKPTVYGENLSSLIEEYGLTVNALAYINGMIVLNTDKGTWQIIEETILKTTDTGVENIINLVKLNDTVLTRSEILAYNKEGETGIEGYDGTTVRVQFPAVDGMNIRNVQQGLSCYYMFSNTGISSIANVNDTNLVNVEQRLDDKLVNGILGSNKYSIENDIMSFIEKKSYVVDNEINVGKKISDPYQYNKKDFYFRNNDILYRVNKSLDSATSVIYNGLSVKNEYDNFTFVRSGSDLYYQGEKLFSNDYVDNTDMYSGGYLKYGDNQVHKFHVGDSYNMILTAPKSNGTFKLAKFGSEIMVACPDGWYKYDNGLTNVLSGSIPNKKAPYYINTTEINQFTGRVVPKYIVAINGDDIYQSLNPSSGYSYMFSVGHSDINTFIAPQSYKYLIGTKDQGIWFTHYAFDMVDHIQAPSRSEITERVNAVYELSMQNHINQYHKDNGETKSTIKYINENLMSPQFDNISSSWEKETKTSDNFIVVENDIVDYVKFDSVQNPIKVEVSNDYTQGKYTDISGVTFIYKNWTSGQKELYVHIPTTETYYNPHLSGIPYCRNYQDEVIRPNTGISSISDIHDDSTTIKVTIIRKFFDNVRNFSDIIINGQSLPKKIYIDTTYDCSGAQDYFHSVVKKSVFCRKVQEPENIVLYFKCFGTDEQALKLIGF